MDRAAASQKAATRTKLLGPPLLEKEIPRARDQWPEDRSSGEEKCLDHLCLCSCNRPTTGPKECGRKHTKTIKRGSLDWSVSLRALRRGRLVGHHAGQLDEAAVIGGIEDICKVQAGQAKANRQPRTAGEEGAASTPEADA